MMCMYNADGSATGLGNLWQKTDRIANFGTVGLTRAKGKILGLNEDEFRDPLNIFGAQTARQTRDENRAADRMYANAPKLQKDINRRYGLNGQSTILGG